MTSLFHMHVLQTEKVDGPDFSNLNILLFSHEEWIKTHYISSQGFTYRLHVAIPTVFCANSFSTPFRVLV